MAAHVAYRYGVDLREMPENLVFYSDISPVATDICDLDKAFRKRQSLDDIDIERVIYLGPVQR